MRAKIKKFGIDALIIGVIVAASVGLGIRVAGVPSADQTPWRAFGEEPIETGGAARDARVARPPVKIDVGLCSECRAAALRGNFAEGWRLYEWRWQRDAARIRERARGAGVLVEEAVVGKGRGSLSEAIIAPIDA